MMQMCGEQVLVPIPDLLWEAGAIHNFDAGHPEYGIDGEGRRCLRLDACIVPVVQRLWDQGVVTLACCCGHGDPWGVITIQTQAGVGQRGAMVMRAERYEALLAAEAERDTLKARNAQLEPLYVAVAAMFFRNDDSPEAQNRVADAFLDASAQTLTWTGPDGPVTADLNVQAGDEP